jgi:hypothetical protein
MNKPQSINIEFHDVGCVMKIGDKTIAYNDRLHMLTDLGAYVNHPEETMGILQDQHPSLQSQDQHPSLQSPFS